jgi:hypothetical protein
MIGGWTRRPPVGSAEQDETTQAAVGTGWVAGEPLWRREQRTRRRRLTQRGRATLASVTFLSVVVLGWVTIRSRPCGAAARPDLPAVSAGAPRVEERADVRTASVDRDVAASAVPSFVLERVPITRAALALPITGAAADAPPQAAPGHLFERVAAPSGDSEFTVEYTLDAQLTHQVFDVLSDGRVGLGNVIVMDPHQGRVLAYASTDVEAFRPRARIPPLRS